MFQAIRHFCNLILLLLVASACATTATHTDEPGKPAAVTQQNQVSESYSKAYFGLLAPLMGVWQIQDWQLQQDGQWQEQAGARWSFYPIQGGTALEDVWVGNNETGNQVSGYGTHIRVFEPLSRSWQSAWLSSRTRTLEFYSGVERDNSVIFTTVPNAKGRITRTVFSNIHPDYFNWRMDWSNDGGESWLPVYKADANRIK